MNDLIGEQLGQYKITAFLGRGGMANVYRAQQQSIEREVAIKVIRPDMVIDDPVFIKRFQREASIIASLSHPHILKVFDYGQHEDVCYLVMELLSSGTLSSLIKKGPLSLDLVMRVTEQVSTALSYAHRRGVIHRDLKPQNILLDEEQNAFLTDFGLAKLSVSNSTLTQTGLVVGSPTYMSPEQWRGDAIDTRTDIYSLGVILFEMIAGKVPFHAETLHALMYSHMQKDPPSLRDYTPDIPAELDNVIYRALAKDPDHRFESASALNTAFKSAMNKTPTGLVIAPDALHIPGIEIPAQSVELPRTAPFVPATGSLQASLTTIFEYLAVRIQERPPEQPFLLNAIRSAILDKFPAFSFPAYALSGFQEFLSAGEKAGYFKLVNTGNVDTSYLLPGTVAVDPQKTTPKPPGFDSNFAMPGLEWSSIPAGEMLFEGITYGVAPFRISKYPITNKQFQQFLEDRFGFGNKQWWRFSPEAIQWRESNTQPVKAQYPDDDTPRESVCWFEAVAFCHWLSYKLNMAITLPTEQQWQRAAQGDDGREYPWGNGFDSTRCNTKESGMGRPTPVERYINAASPFGVVDMVGNVREWCLTSWQVSETLDLTGDAPRGSRGGSWYDARAYARVAYRMLNNPDSRYGYLGFRLATRPKP